MEKPAQRSGWGSCSRASGPDSYLTLRKGGQDYQATLAAWEKAKALISGGETDVVILDEFTYPLTFGWLDVGEVVAWFKANKPDRLHLVLTGRNAPDELVDYADMVTEMREVKHPFRLQQIPAQKGIDF